MRFQDIIVLLSKSVITFILGAAMFLLPLFVCCFFKHKKLKKAIENVIVTKIIVKSLFVGYLFVVLYCTLIYKGIHASSEANIIPLYTYIFTWNNFSLYNWELIVFNILLFIPFGFVIILHFKYLQKWRQVIIFGFLSSLCIELIQLKFMLGVFDVDDVINNTLGTMLGFFIIKAFIRIKNREKKRIAILYMIPMFIVIGAFTCIYITYVNQPYGNMPCDYIYKVDTSGVKITSSISSSSISYVPIYIMHDYSDENVTELVKNVFSMFDCDFSNVEINEYPDQVFFTNRNEYGSSLVIYKKDLSYKYSNSQRCDMEYQCNKYKKNEVINILLERGITIPSEYDFNLIGEDVYVFDGYAINENLLISGTLKCQINKAGELVYLYNGIIKTEEFTKLQIINADEAVKKIYDGKFTTDYSKEIVSIDLIDYSLEYRLDTKGFMQPVYVFNSIINNDSSYKILVLAINKNAIKR